MNTLPLTLVFIWLNVILAAASNHGKHKILLFHFKISNCIITMITFYHNLLLLRGP